MYGSLLWYLRALATRSRRWGFFQCPVGEKGASPLATALAIFSDPVLPFLCWEGFPLEFWGRGGRLKGGK